MRYAPRLATGLLLVTTWTLAAAHPFVGETTRTLAAWLAVCFLPGYLAERILATGRCSKAEALELPARAFAFSLAIVAIIAAACCLLGLSIWVLLVLLFALSMFAVLRASVQQSLPACDCKPSSSSRSYIALGIVLVIALGIATVAAGTENIARDRMWYLAFVTRLASGAPIGWTDPFFGSGHFLARFAGNAWLVSLAAWKALAGAPGPLLFQRFAPPALVLLVASASLALGRALFGRGWGAVVAALASLLLPFTTHYPFFSPERYLPLGRLAEDKTVAVLILLPLAAALAIDFLRAHTATAARVAVALVLVLLALGSTHALAYLLLLITMIAFAVYYRAGAEPAVRRRLLILLVLLAVAALPPAVLGLTARQGMTSIVAFSPGSDLTHPVLRSHLRMQRLLELPAGGPVVRPRLVGDPFLLLSLLGLGFALARRRSLTGAYLLSCSAACLGLAFLPGLAPAFGRLVLPWMAYRALWGVPFAMLLGLVLLEAARLLVPYEGKTWLPALLIAFLVAGLAWHELPWQRMPSSWPVNDKAMRLAPDASTVALLGQIARLPPSSRVAAASGLAELIPAYTGRSVLAFSDRGTVFFTGDRRLAEQRLRANAALLGLYGGSRRLRNHMAGSYGITHTVYEQHPCDRRAAELFRNERFTLCAERAHPAHRAHLARLSAVATDTDGEPALLRLGQGLECLPAPERAPSGLYHWHRPGRWSGQPVVVECQAKLAEPISSGRLRIVAALPHAREAVVYRIRATTAQGAELKRQGVLEFRGNPVGELKLPGYSIRSFWLRIVPAYLPYLNLRAIDLLPAGSPR